MIENRLLVLNYVMDEENQLLSHQAEIVNLIAQEFDHISVLTGRIGKVVVPSNVTLKSYVQNVDYLGNIIVNLIIKQLEKKRFLKQIQ